MRRRMGCESPIPRKRVRKIYIYIYIFLSCFSCCHPVSEQKVEPGSTMYSIQARITTNAMDTLIDNVNLDRQGMTNMELHFKIGLIIKIDKARHKKFHRNHMQRT